MISQEVFNKQYSKYYSLFYAEKNYSSEVDYVDKVIKRTLPKASRILEYGSGTGGHGLLLKELGYDISGIEQSSEMAKIALERGFDCRVGNMIDYSIDSKFEVIIALFHVISYVNSNEQLLKLFSNTRLHLQPKGLFVFDVWFTPAVIYQMPEVRVKKVEDEEIAITRVAEPYLDHLSNVVDVNYHIFAKNKLDGTHGEFKEKHSMRHFGVPEIDLLATRTGFTLIKAEEFGTGKEPSIHTWGVSFILQAI